MTAEQNKPEESKKSSNPWVLVVEDDPFIQKAYRIKLALEHIDHKIAADGEEALNMAKSGEPPALILLDLMLPKKSGFEVLEELKKDGRLKKTPVIIQSNLSQEADKERGLQMGAAEYVVKSALKIDELVRKIKGYLRR